jgi:nicotinamidase/pyrazinamidase
MRPHSEALLELRRRELRRRERQEFGGQIQWEAAFFGLLAAIGLGASLLAMVLGGMVAAGVTSFSEEPAELVDRIMAGGGAIAIAILALAYLAGGYVAARMARFDGWRQGVGIFLLSLLIVLAAAITAWIAGGELDPTSSVALPDNPVDEGPLNASAWVIAGILVVVPLLSALIGGVLGERFHRAVDQAAFEGPELFPERDSTGSNLNGDRNEMANALLIIDFQNDFTSGGRLAVPGGDEIAGPVRRLAKQFDHVFATRDWHPRDHSSFETQGGPWPVHCVQGTHGAELHAAMRDIEVEEIVDVGVEREDQGYSGFEKSKLADLLRERGVDEVAVVGLATDYCVRASAIDAAREGFDVSVVTDAIRAVDVNPGDGERALKDMEEAGAKLVTSESLAPTRG